MYVEATVYTGNRMQAYKVVLKKITRKFNCKFPYKENVMGL